MAPLQFKEIRDKTMGEPHALQVRPLAKEIPRCPILVGLQVQQLQEFVSVITYLQGVLHGELMVARVLFLLEGFKVAKVFMVDYQEVHFLGVVEAFPVIRLEEGFREAEEAFLDIQAVLAEVRGSQVLEVEDRQVVVFLAIQVVDFLAILVEAIPEHILQACRHGWEVFLHSRSP